jgi:autotransporter-associated beta strand protein
MPRSIFVTALICLAMPAAASAAYVLSPTVDGQSSLSVVAGTPFSLDLNLTSTDADFHFGAVFTVDFSAPGLRYLGHTWAAPYDTSSPDNRSRPGNSATPALIDANSYIRTSADPGAVDLYFENLIETGQFDTGRLVTLHFEVPADFSVDAMTIRSLPVEFENGNGVPTDGRNFLLKVTQSPAMWSGGADDDRWSSAANWGVGGGPRSARLVVFAGDTGLTPHNDMTGFVIGGLVFDAAAGSFVLGGESLQIAGSIDNRAASAQQIDLPIEFVPDAPGGGIHVEQAVGRLLLSQPVSGEADIVKTGAGTARMAGINTYTGDTCVLAGTLEVDDGITSNGTGAGSTFVGSAEGGEPAILITSHLHQHSLTIYANGLVELTPSVAASTASAVPEPAAWILLALAVSIGWIVRHR